MYRLGGRSSRMLYKTSVRWLACWMAFSGGKGVQVGYVQVGLRRGCRSGPSGAPGYATLDHPVSETMNNLLNLAEPLSPFVKSA